MTVVEVLTELAAALTGYRDPRDRGPAARADHKRRQADARAAVVRADLAATRRTAADLAADIVVSVDLVDDVLAAVHPVSGELHVDPATVRAWRARRRALTGHPAGAVR